MNCYFLDTSALIKHYVTEVGSDWLNSTIVQPAANLLLISRIAVVEVRSALARRKREASIQPSDHADAVRALGEDCLLRYRFVELEAPVVDLAGELLDRSVLRAYDAVQLASALVVNRLLTDAKVAPITFVCADSNLLAAAQSAGLLTDNPNLHV